MPCHKCLAVLYGETEWKEERGRAQGRGGSLRELTHASLAQKHQPLCISTLVFPHFDLITQHSNILIPVCHNKRLMSMVHSLTYTPHVQSAVIYWIFLFSSTFSTCFLYRAKSAQALDMNDLHLL